VPLEVLMIEVAEFDTVVDEIREEVGLRPMIPSGDKEVLVAELAVVLAEVDAESTAPEEDAGTEDEIGEI